MQQNQQHLGEKLNVQELAAKFNQVTVQGHNSKPSRLQAYGLSQTLGKVPSTGTSKT
jgi:hypothetical protein